MLQITHRIVAQLFDNDEAEDEFEDVDEEISSDVVVDIDQLKV